MAGAGACACRGGRAGRHRRQTGSLRLPRADAAKFVLACHHRRAGTCASVARRPRCLGTDVRQTRGRIGTRAARPCTATRSVRNGTRRTRPPSAPRHLTPRVDHRDPACGSGTCLLAVSVWQCRVVEWPAILRNSSKRIVPREGRPNLTTVNRDGCSTREGRACALQKSMTQRRVSNALPGGGGALSARA